MSGVRSEILVLVAEAGRVKSFRSSGKESESEMKAKLEIVNTYKWSITLAQDERLIPYLCLMLLVFCSFVFETMTFSMTLALCFHLGF